MMLHAAFYTARSLLRAFDREWNERHLYVHTREERVVFLLFLAAVLESEGL